MQNTGKYTSEVQENMEFYKAAIFLIISRFIVADSNHTKKEFKMTLLDENKAPLMAMFDMSDVNRNIESYVEDAIESALTGLIERKTKEAVEAGLKGVLKNNSTTSQHKEPSTEDVAETREEMDILSDRMKNLRRKLNTWTGDHGKPQRIDSKTVAFTALLSSSKTYGAEQIIRYDNVLTNVGKAFNMATGIFTVSTSGIYTLSVSMMGSPSNGIHLQLVQNGKEIVRLWTGGGGSYELASQTVNVLLSKNDKVWVQRLKGTGSNIYGGERYNVFSGALLYTTE